MMLSHERHHQHQSSSQTSNSTRDILKQPTLGTLSSETTTSSGYSTGASSVATSINQSLKKSLSNQEKSQSHPQKKQKQKTKSKGLPNLFNKLKNLLLPSKNKSLSSKPIRSMATSRQISSINILRQYSQPSPIYDRLPSSSSITTSNAISLPFTYYHSSPIGQSRTNFDKISAWLNHTEKSIKPEQNDNFTFIDGIYHPLTLSCSNDIDDQEVTIVMKNNSINIRPPKRSSSLVTRFTRPIFEQTSQKALSTSSSFSSSILMRGMSETMTPPSVRSQKSSNHLSKSARHRTTENLPRQSTVININEIKSIKENLFGRKYDQSIDNIYQFPTLSSNNKVLMHLPPSGKQISTKKYYFHSNPIRSKEDLLNNSYGLTLLHQQPRHSDPTTALMISQVPNQVSSHKPPLTPRISTKFQHEQYQHTPESLDDLLCDQEVESYFYPVSSQPEHIYVNIKDPSSPSISPIHGTLC